MLTKFDVSFIRNSSHFFFFFIFRPSVRLQATCSIFEVICDCFFRRLVPELLNYRKKKHFLPVDVVDFDFVTIKSTRFHF